jgi:hypothetical protein
LISPWNLLTLTRAISFNNSNHENGSKTIFLSFLTHVKGISQFQIQRDSISVLISFDATSKIEKSKVHD